jgi:hypothetical protein
LNFYQRKDGTFDLPKTILCDIDFCAEDLKHVFKRLPFLELWRIDLQVGPLLQSGLEYARHDRCWFDIGRSRSDGLSCSEASTRVCHAFSKNRKTRDIFLVAILSASLEGVAPFFCLFQLGLIGCARLKLCFVARTGLIVFLFQPIEEGASAFRQCVEILLCEFTIERSAFYGSQVAHNSRPYFTIGRETHPD